MVYQPQLQLELTTMVVEIFVGRHIVVEIVVSLTTSEEWEPGMQRKTDVQWGVYERVLGRRDRSDGEIKRARR